MVKQEIYYYILLYKIENYLITGLLDIAFLLQTTVQCTVSIKSSVFFNTLFNFYLKKGWQAFF